MLTIPCKPHASSRSLRRVIFRRQERPWVLNVVQGIHGPHLDPTVVFAGFLILFRHCRSRKSDFTIGKANMSFRVWVSFYQLGCVCEFKGSWKMSLSLVQFLFNKWVWVWCMRNKWARVDISFFVVHEFESSCLRTNVFELPIFETSLSFKNDFEHVPALFIAFPLAVLSWETWCNEKKVDRMALENIVNQVKRGHATSSKGWWMVSESLWSCWLWGSQTKRWWPLCPTPCSSFVGQGWIIVNMIAWNQWRMYSRYSTFWKIFFSIILLNYTEFTINSSIIF